MESTNQHNYYANSASMGGEYVVRVEKANGEIEYPFGQTPRKNLILDDFFDKWISGSVIYCNFDAITQSMIVGSGAGATTAAVRTQTGLQGSLAMTTHASTSLNRSFNTGMLLVGRDFKFNAYTGAPSITIDEAVVGSFGISNITNYSLSRFVFPSSVTLNTNDNLYVYYSFSMADNLATSAGVPISITGAGLDFSGNIFYGGKNYLCSYPNYNFAARISMMSPPNFLWRDFTVNSTASNTDNQSYSNLSLFCENYTSTTAGFYLTGHTPVALNASTIPGAFTAQGPTVSTRTRTNYTKADSGCYIDETYLFPAHTGIRTGIAGLYLINAQINSVYWKFNANQTIPANVPVQFTLRWKFDRQ